MTVPILPTKCSVARGRALALAASIGLFGLCTAQKAAELDYLIHFAGPVSTLQEKYVHEALQSHEPGLGVWMDVPYHQVKVRTHAPLDRPTLEAAWQSVGLVIDYLGPVNGTNAPQLRSTTIATSGGLPVFSDTGNPAADNAAYEAAKAAWINAHPADYEELQAPQPE